MSSAMKLIVQIPVYNESDTIEEVITHIPRHIPGISCVEVLIIDDGCTDDTIERATLSGANHIVHHTSRKGLAMAYQTGIDAALRLGADIIVNTDGDHQYPGSTIPQLIEPIVARKADIVIGDRQVSEIEHFSPFKKLLQYIGSSVVRWASGTNIPDTVSGFRALSREAALRMFVTSDFSYTVESVIQAGKKRLTLQTVPVITNPARRASRLHQGNWNFVKKQASIIAKTYATYEPLKAFSYLAMPFIIIGFLLLVRATYIYIGRNLGIATGSNEQSLIGGGFMLVVGVLILMLGVLADRVGGARRVQEEALYRIRKQELLQEAQQQRMLDRLKQLTNELQEHHKALGVDLHQAQSYLISLHEIRNGLINHDDNAATSVDETWHHSILDKLSAIERELQTQSQERLRTNQAWQSSITNKLEHLERALLDEIALHQNERSQ